MSLQLSAAGQLPCTAKKLQDGLQQQKQLSRMQSAVTFIYMPGASVGRCRGSGFTCLHYTRLGCYTMQHSYSLFLSFTESPWARSKFTKND